MFTNRNLNLKDVWFLFWSHASSSSPIKMSVPTVSSLPLITILCCFVLFLFLDKVSLCNPYCPGADCVDQDDFKLTKIPLSWSSEN